VVLYGTVSATADMSSGLPQGFILGPLLFVIFMDSICALNVSPGSDLTLFADDISYYKEVADSAERAVVQSDVCSITS